MQMSLELKDKKITSVVYDIQLHDIETTKGNDKLPQNSMQV